MTPKHMKGSVADAGGASKLDQFDLTPAMGRKCFRCGHDAHLGPCVNVAPTPSDKQEAKPPVAYHSFEECAKSVWDEMGNAPATPIDKQEPFAWMRPDVLDRLKSTIAYSAGTELLKNRKDGYVPIYAAPLAAPSDKQEARIDALFARVTDWVNENGIPFEAQNDLFRILGIWGE